MFTLINDPDTAVLHAIDPKTLTETQRRYGVSPKHSPAVEYQPEVIIMEHGDEAIRAFANDGMTWQFDANAPQVDQFQEGKIIFATGLAVGRIVNLKRAGNLVTVVLGPIQLTDIIKNGKFAMQEPVDVANVLVYQAPNFPQPQEQTTDLDTSSAITSDFSARPYPVQLQVTPGITQLPHPPSPLPPLPAVPAIPPVPGIPNADALGNLAVVNIDEESRMVPIFNPKEIGVQLYYYKPGGPSVMAEAAMSVRKLAIYFELLIRDGKILTCGINIDGALGVRMHMGAQTYGKDYRVNWNRELWLPLDLKIPLGLNGVSPVPFSITFNNLLDFGTGFSAKRASLDADGDYTFSGGLFAGYKNGDWTVSKAGKVEAVKDLGVTMTGLSVGINSLRLSAAVRAMVGIGAFGFNTGVFGQVRFGGTILRAPDIAWACRKATIEAHFDSGIGYSLPQLFADAINLLLSVFTHYKISQVGSILPAPSRGLFHGFTEIPTGCATPKSSTTPT